MIYVQENKKYDTTTSTEIFKAGFENAMSASDGQVTIYKSKKGTIWGTFKYWSNSHGPQNITHFVGESQAKSYLSQAGRDAEIENLFGNLEEA